MRIDKNTTIRLGNRNIVKVKLGDVVIWQKTTGPVVEPDYFYIESLGDGNTISVKNKGSGDTSSKTPTLEYSTDKNTWNTITFDWTYGEHTTELPVKLNTGEKMYFRNDTRKFSEFANYITFSSSVSSNVGGDIRTLSNYLDVDNETRPQLNMFKNLFYNNKNIVDASNLRLSYTRLEQRCYDSMFYGCTSLTTTPALPAVNLKFYCYDSMFYGCTSLTTTPTLPATNLESGCYNQMFSSCSKLTTAPALPATNLEDGCYRSMFQGCTSLTTAPALPATTLADECYQSMFNGCTSLTTAPALPATTLVSNCYDSMFNGCSSLNKILVYANSGTTSGNIDNWLNGVAASGTFYNVGGETYTKDSASGIPTGWSEVTTVLTTSVYAVPNTFSVKSWETMPKLNYMIIAENETGIDVQIGNTVSPQIGENTGSSTRMITKTYSYDGIDYTITINQTANDTDEPEYFYIESLDDGNTVTLNTYLLSLGYSKSMTPTLQFSTDKRNWSTVTFDWSKTGNKNIDIPTILNTGDKMYFRNDTGKFSLGSNSEYYNEVYYSKISFSTNKNTNVGGDIRTLLNYIDVETSSMIDKGTFIYLFRDNTHIVDASNLRLQSTNLESGCYQSMFQGCTSLTTAPELPATSLVNDCYYGMFQGCTSLTTAPALPATTLKYSCYRSMFQGCNSLTSVTIYATSTAYNSLGSWLNNVAPSGTVYNNGLLDLPKNDVSGVPSGWTENIPPIQSITANPNTFTIEFNNETVTCNSTLEVVTTVGTFTKTNSETFTVGENTGDTTRTLKKTIPYYNSSYDVTIVQSAIQSITANPDTFTIKSYKNTVRCTSTLTIATTLGTTVTDTNSATITVGENTGDTTRTLTETIPYKGSSYQVTIVQTANNVKPAISWNVESTGTYPFQLNTNNYYESTNKGHDSSYSYATLNYSGFDELVLECINSGESNYDYGIISQPDVLLSESYEDDGATGSTKVFKNFKGESSTNPVQITIPSDEGSHFITIKFRKDSSSAQGNDSLQFKVIEP